MRERHADTGGKKCFKALDPGHHEVTKRKDKEQNQQQFAPFKSSRNDCERQRHNGHHKRVTRQNKSGKGHGLMETLGNIGE